MQKPQFILTIEFLTVVGVGLVLSLMLPAKVYAESSIVDLLTGHGLWLNGAAFLFALATSCAVAFFATHAVARTQHIFMLILVRLFFFCLVALSLGSLVGALLASLGIRTTPAGFFALHVLAATICLVTGLVGVAAMSRMPRYEQARFGWHRDEKDVEDKTTSGE